MDLELELEWRYCYPRESGLSLYCAAKEAGKHIAIVTDMYLPIDQIVRMLQKVGAGDYDLLLLSSELGYSKANGGIYRQLKRMEIPPKQFLQIGDNRIADVENPRCLGLQGMWLPEPCSSITGDYIQQFRQNSLLLQSVAALPWQ